MLLLFAILLLYATAPSAAVPVRDLDGRALRPNTEYYVLPVVRGRGGGLTLRDRNNSCPLYVAQDRFEVSDGLPVKFLPANPRSTTIQLSQDVNAQFRAITTCIQSLVWTLSGDGGNGTTKYVATNGVVGNPGQSTLSNWFRIDRSGTDYKFVFCPAVCSFCRPVCGDLGVFFEDNNIWLGVGLGGTSFPVMFKRVRRTGL